MRKARHPGEGRDPSALMTICVLVFFSSFVVGAPPKMGSVPPLKFNPPEPERVVLKNGVVVYLLEDNELPLFSLSLRMKTSPADVSENIRGAKSFFGTVWRSGGTKKREPEKLNEELEFMPAKVETSAGEESISISLSCLSGDIEKGLEIFADVLFNPEFRKEKLELAKSSTMESLRRKNDTPVSISRRAFRDVLYGPTHVYAWDITPAAVKRIKRKNLMALHKKLVVPDQAIIAISGDFKRDNILSQLETLFKDWKPTGRKVPEYDYGLKKLRDGSLFYVEKDFNQSRIYVGKLGIARHNPDEFALSLGNYILGGGGTSRLFAEIRSRLGLAYVVGSFYSKSKAPGLVGAGIQTKASSTIQALNAMRKELDAFTKKPPTKEEMKLAKDSILNAFVFRFESKDVIVSEQASLEFYGYPSDYLKTYPDRIRAVTSQDVLNASKKYFSAKDRKVVVVGNQSKFEEKLETLGSVVEIPLEEID